MNENGFNIAFLILSDLGILEVDMIEKIFQSNMSLEAKNRHIKLFWIKRKIYQKGVDDKIYKRLKSLCASAFPLIPTREIKTMFGKSKMVWNCGVCSAENDVDNQQNSIFAANALRINMAFRIKMKVINRLSKNLIAESPFFVHNAKSKTAI